MNKAEKLQLYAKELRQKPSLSQTILFEALHNSGRIRIRRRLVIGNYILQFAIPSRNVLIEIDSPKSLENPMRLYKREAWLQAEGFIFLRFKDEDISNQLNEIVKLINSFEESEEIRKQFWRRVRDLR